MDYLQGYTTISPVMLAPFLVTALTLFALFGHMPKLQLNRYFPFVLIFLGLFYAYAVGVYHGGLFSATYQLLEWTVPVMFAFYLVVHWGRYPEFRRTIQRTFVSGVLVMGAYGLVQFFVLPPWDQYWMENAPMTSIGYPEPLEVRVFSTVNSPHPFAMTMMAGLLLLFGGGGYLRLPVAVVGYLSFLLSVARTAWGGWLVALLFIISAPRGRFRLRLLVALAVTALVLFPLISFGPVADTVNSRLETFTNLEQDASFRDRLEFYGYFLPRSFLNPIGEGFGATGESTKLDSEGGVGELGENAAFDSGIMEIPFLFGWPGSLLYVGGLLWLLSYALRNSDPTDLFATTSRGIVVALLCALVSDETTAGLVGMLLWTFLGSATAAGIIQSRTPEDGGSEPAALESQPGDRKVGQHNTMHEGARGGVSVLKSWDLRP